MILSETDTDHTRSIETERALLAIVLEGRTPNAWSVISEHNPALDSWTTRPHQLLAMVCQRMALEGSRIDAQGVCHVAGHIRFQDGLKWLGTPGTGIPGLPSRDRLSELASDPTLDFSDSVLAAIGGFSFVSDLSAMYAPASGLEESAKRLARYARQRRLRDIGQAIVSKATAVDGFTKLEAIADEASASIATLSVGFGAGPQTMSAAIDSVLSEHDRLRVGGERLLGTWGLKGLDDLVELEASRLVTLSAGTGCGKSSLMSLLAYRTAERLGPNAVALASLEMTPQELATITITREAGVDRRTIQSGMLTPIQREDVMSLRQKVAGMDFALRPPGRMTVLELEGWIRRVHAKSGGRLHLVAIDYLQLIAPTNPKAFPSDALAEITGRLKQIALSLGICVVLLSQMSRAAKPHRGKSGEIGPPQEPMLSDLHGSSSIEKDSDAVVFVWTKTPDDRASHLSTLPVEIKVAKNRAGRKGTVHAEFRKGDGQTFVETRPIRPGDAGQRAAKIDSAPSASEDLF